jgi:segregation and condensation protein A
VTTKQDQQPDQVEEEPVEAPTEEQAEQQVESSAEEPAVEPEGDQPVPKTESEEKPEPLPGQPRVHLEIFEGPLDLLLFLIRKNEYDIFDIPIAEVTTQYLKYLDVLQELDLEIAGEFLVMAATLMKIKSHMLLPRQDEIEEEDEEDPRAALIRQILEYQRYKEAAEELIERDHLGREVFARKFESPELTEAQADESGYLEADLYDLIEAIRAVLKRLPERSAHIVRLEPYSIQERMTQLTNRLKSVTSITFDALFDGAADRIEVVTTFLALLEMIRQQLVSVYQADIGGTIRIVSQVTDVTDEDEPESGGEG